MRAYKKLKNRQGGRERKIEREKEGEKIGTIKNKKKN